MVVKTLTPGVALLVAAGLSFWNGSQSRPAQRVEASAHKHFSFRIIFGEKQEEDRDYSGSLTLSAGRIVRLAPWRFFGEDALEGTRWKLHIKRAIFENQPDRPVPQDDLGPLRNLVPAGLTVTVDAPADSTAEVRTASANFVIHLADLKLDRDLRFNNGDISVKRTPVSEPVSLRGPAEKDYPSLTVTAAGAVWIAWQAYRDRGDHVWVRHSDASGWSVPVRLTEDKGDIFRTAVGEDRTGRIWVIWSERTGEEWDLYARAFDGAAWSTRHKLTSGNSPNMFHRLVRDSFGALHLVWVGYRNGESHVLWSKLNGDTWAEPIEISGANAWSPEAASDSKGNLYVAWDSYRTGNYDIFLRRVGADGALGPVEQVTHSPIFQAHPTVAVDRQDRVWLAWDESGINWGKDWNHEDFWRATVLYADRHPRIAVRTNGAWVEPSTDIMAAIPERYNRYVQLPRIVSDRTGRIWVDLQIRTSSSTNRADFWASYGRWEHFLTTLGASGWTRAMPVPETSSRPEGPFALGVGGDGLWMAWTNHTRPFGARGGADVGSTATNEIYAAQFADTGPAPTGRFVSFAEARMPSFAVHPQEAADLMRVRNWRVTVDNQSYRILRGDFHRHTEISSDGAGDGSLEDYFRYMLDAANMDTGIISDHSAGNDNEYTWWRTEKAIDLFHIRDRFIPLFGYERSVEYPNGHRNLIFASRGVRTLPISREENQGKLNSGPILYPYLRQHGGICMLHSLATDQGSDFRDNDPALEPLVEIYQGYHASYEYEGAPRAETESHRVRIHGDFRPAGFYWNALAKGYKLGVESSSDHISTHCSYTMIYTPSTQRADIVESMRRRHTYGATDNIILDYRAVDDAGRVHMMGDAFAATATATPRLKVSVIGTARILKIDVIKDGKFVFTSEPDANTADFTYIDIHHGVGESYYYIRAVQIDRNLAWSSPIWVKYVLP